MDSYFYFIIHNKTNHNKLFLSLDNFFEDTGSGVNGFTTKIKPARLLNIV